ncbi:MAG: hypothetical protein WBF34_29510 [Streptosporangiaceae bacterium]
MEAVIGFAVGYWVGTRQGRQGLQKALDSAQAIWASPETKRLLSEGLSAFETVAAPALDRLGKSNRRSALISTVVDELIERRQSRRAA